MGLQVIKKTFGQAKTEVELKSGAVKATDEIKGEHVSMEEPAIVTVSLSFTKNLGNYESARLQVSLAMPCDAEPVVIEKTFEDSKTWCDEKLQSMIKELDE